MLIEPIPTLCKSFPTHKVSSLPLDRARFAGFGGIDVADDSSLRQAKD
jgi:hypothetical protein